jgi:protein-disulfide isomerase
MGKNRMDAGRGSGRPDGVKKGGGAQPAGGRSSVRRAKQGQGGKFAALLAAIVVIGAAALGYAYQSSRKPIATVDPNLPPLAARGYALGDTNAPLQVLEFGDFECPQCANFAIVTEPDVRKRLVETGQISIRYFDFPLPMHPNTWPASHAAACADEQGKFWPMHDQLYARQEEWNGRATSNPKKLFMAYATGLALDAKKFEECYDAKKYQRQIDANRLEAERRQVNSTPTFVIGKRVIPGNLPYDKFKSYVDSALAEVKASAAAPKA